MQHTYIHPCTHPHNRQPLAAACLSCLLSALCSPDFSLVLAGRLGLLALAHAVLVLDAEYARAQHLGGGVVGGAHQTHRACRAEQQSSAAEGDVMRRLDSMRIPHSAGFD